MGDIFEDYKKAKASDPDTPIFVAPDELQRILPCPNCGDELWLIVLPDNLMHAKFYYCDHCKHAYHTDMTYLGTCDITYGYHE